MSLENLAEGHLSVAVADDEPFLQMYLEETVRMLGYDVTIVASDGQELLEKCTESRPDLVVTDVKMPRMNGLDAVRAMSIPFPIPAVLLTGYGHMEPVIRAETRSIITYIIKPVDEAALHKGMSLAMLRFHQFNALLDEEGDLETALNHRGLVEQAKQALMRSDGLEEAHAFDVLVSASRHHNQRIIETCRMLLASQDPSLDADRLVPQPRPTEPG